MPYARETRFKGRKRVSVGFCSTNRIRSTEKRETENKRMSSENSVKKMTGTTKDESQSEVQRTGKRPCVPLESGKQMEVGRAVKNLKGEASSEVITSDSVEIKEEVQDMDMFCISALAERNARSDSADNAGDDSGDNTEVYVTKEELNTDTVCAFCYLDCHTSADLKKHLRTHTGEKPHECDLCELAFARASHLARHRRVHTGERPFTCDGCGRTFSRQDKLKQHARRHHAADPAKARSVCLEKLRRPRGRPPKVTTWDSFIGVRTYNF